MENDITKITTTQNSKWEIDLPHRQKEANEIIDSLAKTKRWRESSSAFNFGMADQFLIEGPTGTGKTSVIQNILPILKLQGFSIKMITAQETDARTAYTLMDKPFYKGASYSKQDIEAVINSLGPNPLIIIDDIQTLVLNSERQNILYILTRYPNLYLITISSEPSLRSYIADKSIQDSFFPEVIHFYSYTEDQVKDIIKFYDNAKLLDDNSIAYFAQLVGVSGSARPVVFTYGYFSKNFDPNEDTLTQINNAYKKYILMEIRQTVSSLSPLSKQILTMMLKINTEGIKLNELISEYNKCNMPVQYHRFRQAIEELEKKSLVTWSVHGLGRQRGVSGYLGFSLALYENSEIKNEVRAILEDGKFK